MGYNNPFTMLLNCLHPQASSPTPGWKGKVIKRGSFSLDPVWCQADHLNLDRYFVQVGNQNLVCLCPESS
jgi:hypothetical protein